MQKEDTELAFPCDSIVKMLMESGTEGVDAAHVFSGMSLRDYFAAKALPAIIHISYGKTFGNTELGREGCETVANVSYAIADAMLVARIHPTEKT